MWVHPRTTCLHEVLLVLRVLDPPVSQLQACCEWFTQDELLDIYALCEALYIGDQYCSIWDSDIGSDGHGSDFQTPSGEDVFDNVEVCATHCIFLICSMLSSESAAETSLNAS